MQQNYSLKEDEFLLFKNKVNDFCDQYVQEEMVLTGKLKPVSIVLIDEKSIQYHCLKIGKKIFFFYISFLDDQNISTMFTSRQLENVQNMSLSMNVGMTKWKTTHILYLANKMMMILKSFDKIFWNHEKIVMVILSNILTTKHAYEVNTQNIFQNYFRFTESHLKKMNAVSDLKYIVKFISEKNGKDIKMYEADICFFVL